MPRLTYALRPHRARWRAHRRAPRSMGSAALQTHPHTEDHPMPFDLQPLNSPNINPDSIDSLIAQHESDTRPRLHQLWNYYRNPMHPCAGPSRRHARLAQEVGLPQRLTGPRTLHHDDRASTNREIVIENDIAWRVQTMVDFMFGRPITILSTARTPELRRTIERILDRVIEASGGIALLSDIGLLGHVYGHVDLIVRADLTPNALPDAPRTDEMLLATAEHIRLEPIEPTRGIPVLDPADYRRLAAYIIRAESSGIESARPDLTPGVSTRLAHWLTRKTTRTGSHSETRTLTEIISPSARALYINADREPARLLDSGPALVSSTDSERGPVPVIHIQNISQPFRFPGLSEVEPLIPLQDELNTRLSDRASRVTMQSFKMYLAKGLEGFDKIPVGPGQVWATDNPAASVESFGGDGASPSEDAHIEQIREAMDKASGVPPLASGVVRAKVGNLTSENALRITLMGLLSKTARKRVTYGRGLAQACELILLALHRAGALTTDHADRQVRIEWPDPLPRDETEALNAAQIKLALGIPRERVLSELGYAPTDPGIV